LKYFFKLSKNLNVSSIDDSLKNEDYLEEFDQKYQNFLVEQGKLRFSEKINNIIH
jgi:hypothetical protein